MGTHAPGEQTRALQAMATSSPPPSATPSIAATVGLGPDSSSSQKWRFMSCSSGAGAVRKRLAGCGLHERAW